MCGASGLQGKAGSTPVVAVAADATKTMPAGSQAHVANGMHKPLWPLEGRDAAGLIATSAATALAASGGVGGGSLLVPIYILVFGA
jgi:hypothetical protein